MVDACVTLQVGLELPELPEEPDLVIEGSSGISSVRESIHHAQSLSPSSLLLVHRVDLMPKNTVTVLLKFLEDPACRVVLTSNTKDLPDTLKSRCVMKVFYGTLEVSDTLSGTEDFLQWLVEGNVFSAQSYLFRRYREGLLDEELESFQALLLQVWKLRRAPDPKSPLFSLMKAIPLPTLKFLTKRASYLRAQQSQGSVEVQLRAFFSSVSYLLSRKKAADA